MGLIGRTTSGRLHDGTMLGLVGPIFAPRRRQADDHRQQPDAGKGHAQALRQKPPRAYLRRVLLVAGRGAAAIGRVERGLDWVRPWVEALAADSSGDGDRDRAVAPGVAGPPESCRPALDLRAAGLLADRGAGSEVPATPAAAPPGGIGQGLSRKACVATCENC